MYSMENILFTYKILFKCSNGLQNELIFLFLNHSYVLAMESKQILLDMYRVQKKM